MPTTAEGINWVEWILTPGSVNQTTEPDIEEVLSSIPDKFECPNCSTEQEIRDSALVRTQSGVQRWCEDCSDAETFRCMDCSINTSYDYESSDEAGYCVECAQIREEERRENEDYLSDEDEEGLLDYNARIATPMSRWLGYPAANNRYFGIELEVEVKTSIVKYEKIQEVKDYLDMDRFILKYDGSLDYGFEIVSAPATLDKVPDMWAELLKSPPKGLRSNKTDTCGMHVHVSRKSMTPLTLGKALVFANKESNQDFITKVAGRAECEHCQRKNKTIKSGQVVSSTDRYELINITPQTVEFRMFKGTLGYETFMKNVEFCNATIEFCAHTGMKKLHHTDFIEWLKNQSRKTYPNLKKFLLKTDKKTDKKENCSIKCA